MMGPDSSPLAREMADERLDAAVDAAQLAVQRAVMQERMVLARFWARMQALFGVAVPVGVQDADALAAAQERFRQRSPKLVDDLQRWLPFVELKLAEGLPGWRATAAELAQLAGHAHETVFQQAAQACVDCEDAECDGLLGRLRAL